MVSKQKKQIYIGIIAFCVVASVVVIFVSRKSPAPVEPTPAQPAPTAANQAGGLKIFPQSTEFDTSFFGSDTYKLLRPYTAVSISKDEIGREDPFKPF
ncbi:MAG TPA: hypothetical protein VGQ87_03245 [Patescibacteria group bacterium]|jgi:hypothetical protein|nr:hypothetical protein [Patescibacteria group bacterium]